MSKSKNNGSCSAEERIRMCKGAYGNEIILILGRIVRCLLVHRRRIHNMV